MGLKPKDFLQTWLLPSTKVTFEMTFSMLYQRWKKFTAPATLTSDKALCFKQNLFPFVTIFVLLFLSAVEL